MVGEDVEVSFERKRQPSLRLYDDEMVEENECGVVRRWKWKQRGVRPEAEEVGWTRQNSKHEVVTTVVLCMLFVG